jgi:hypothetical protein
LYTLGGSSPAANDDGRLPFSAARYSKYKYGSVAAAETFARALGAAFCQAHPEFALAPWLLMASSPYAHVHCGIGRLRLERPGVQVRP